MMGVIGDSMPSGFTPMRPALVPATVRPKAWGPYPDGSGGMSSGFAYEADATGGPELGGWFPVVRSPDTEINPYRDRRVARTRDVTRNDGWAKGAVNRVLDNTVGSLFRLVAKPDYRALGLACAACTPRWAEEFAGVVESEWRMFADDPAHWCDITRTMSMVQLFRLGLSHKVIDGENLAVLHFDEDSVGPGRARFATRLEIVDPDRLANKWQAADTRHMRGGVEVDDHGAPVAYHFRRAHQNDLFDSMESMQWDRVERETSWGRPQVVHDYDHDRAGQNRGIGVLTPVLARLKMLGRYDAAELQQALLQSVIGTFIESPSDPDQLRLAMEAPEGGATEMNGYQSMRADYYGQKSLSIGDVRIPSLAPGDKINAIPARHPSSNFAEFEHAIIRNVASAVGVTAEQISQDYSRANYSSLRASMLDAWRTMQRRRHDFATGTATPVYGAFLEEVIDRNPGLLPRRAPAFMEMRAAYMRCRWIGPGRGWVDPVKERQGAVLGLDAGFGTLQDECAEIAGADWREQLDQRAIEVRAFHERGLKLPLWGGTDMPASDIDQKPQAT